MANNSAASIQLNALAHDLAAAGGAEFRATAQMLVQSAGQQVQQLAQSYAPRRTGALANSINLLIQDGGMTATVVADRPYAIYDEFGTGVRGEFPGRPIVITPKRAKYLKFQINGRTVYAKRVVNPGMAPRPFLRPAVERVSLPLASSVGNNAVIFVTRGPNAPQSLAVT